VVKSVNDKTLHLEFPFTHPSLLGKHREKTMKENDFTAAEFKQYVT